MSSGKPVAQLLNPLIARMIVVGLLLAGVAAAGVVLSTRAVDYLANDLQPASTANRDILQDLSDSQAAVRYWARTGDRAAVDDYRQAQARLPGDEQAVRRFSRGDAELDALVVRQSELADAYIAESAAPRLAQPGGPDTAFHPQAFQLAVEQFQAFREANAATSAAFEQRLSDARDAADRRLRGTILAVILIAAIGAWVIARTRRRLLAEIADPLKDLELVVQRMASDDREARAAERGPREVRAVSSALNVLADAQSRARAVEVMIQDELRSLDTARHDFVSNVSHELRTPLTTISGYLELVADEFEDRMAPQHQKMLAASRRNVSRLQLLIDDLLTLARAEGRDAEMETVDLGTLVEDVGTDVRMTAARRGITVTVDEPAERLHVVGDRIMLHRALLNLVSNAVKFSLQDGVVDVSLAERDGRIEVVVRDQGIGIPAGELDRLGSRFFRASNAVANEFAGTGLGVRIVQTIVDKHHGQLLIDSVEGVGTTVTMQLPAERAAPAAETAPAEGPARRDPPAEDSRGPRSAVGPGVVDTESTGSPTTAS